MLRQIAIGVDGVTKRNLPAVSSVAGVRAGGGESAGRQHAPQGDVAFVIEVGCIGVVSKMIGRRPASRGPAIGAATS